MTQYDRTYIIEPCLFNPLTTHTHTTRIKKVSSTAWPLKWLG